MISERQFAAGFSSFWSELLPLLTPACVTVFNQSHGFDLDGGIHVDDLVEVPNSDKLPADILSEAAFGMARTANALGESVKDLLSKGAYRADAWRSATERVSRFRNIVRETCPGSDSPIGEFYDLLAKRYDQFAGYAAEHGRIEYSPRVSGCGFLADMEADLAAGAVLFEVKTVSRNFSSNDIRQVITYLALDYCSGARRWSSGGLFNPRRNRVALFEPDKFLTYVSGGKAAVVVYREIQDFLASREWDVEATF